MVSRPNATFPPLPETSFYAAEGVRWHSTRGARKNSLGWDISPHISPYLPISPSGARKNSLGWDIAPFGLYKLLKHIDETYQPRGGIVITESGWPCSATSSHLQP